MFDPEGLHRLMLKALPTSAFSHSLLQIAPFGAGNICLAHVVSTYLLSAINNYRICKDVNFCKNV